jgi:hypothetical protein
VELWRIGNSNIAPKFNIVSKPNLWTRRVIKDRENTEKQQFCLDFWSPIFERLRTKGILSSAARPVRKQDAAFDVGWTCQLSCVSFASYLVRLTPYPNIMTPPFLNMWLNLPETQLRIRQYATPAVHQVNINPTNLRKILVKIPPVPEQAAITRIINQMEATVAIERTCFDKLRLLKSGLMQDLLTGKVRVNVDESTESERDVGVHQS